MQSFGALLAMLSAAALSELLLIDKLPALPLPRSIGNTLLRSVPELFFFLLVTWVLVRLIYKGGLRDVGLAVTRRSLMDFLLYTALGALAVSTLVLPLVWMGMGAFRYSETRMSEPRLAILVLFLLLLAALGEEVAMRGYAFQTLIRPLHLLGALIFVNGIFAALHWVNPSASEYSIANTFLAGCVLGMLLVVRRNLWAPAGAHFGWNAATPLLGVNLSGMPIQISGLSVEWFADPLWTGGAYGPEGSLPCTVLLLSLLLVLTLLYYRAQEPKANPAGPETA